MSTPLPEHLGPRIRAERERRRLSLREFQRRSGVSPGFLSLLETGARRSCGLEYLNRIAIGLDLPLSALLDTEPYEPPTEQLITAIRDHAAALRELTAVLKEALEEAVR